jgi:PleD family two-component response regulator
VAILLKNLCPDNKATDTDFHSKLTKQKVPIILISKDEDMSSRLQTARLGIEHFFTLPINIDVLLETLDQHIILKRRIRSAY